MGEFVEVMKQKERMCKQYSNDPYTCRDCALSFEKNGHRKLCQDLLRVYPEAFEEIVMKWASEHPESKYPSWNEAWKQLFPDSAEKHSPCMRYFMSEENALELCIGTSCNDCCARPIPADIAEKFGVKPLEVRKND